jgi:branched-chain amino acid transport system permease protein
MNTTATAAGRAANPAWPAPALAASPWWAIAAGAAVPLIAAGVVRDPLTSSILSAASVQGLFALSWVLLAATGQPSLGHALPYGAGAYAAAFIARRAAFESSTLNSLMPVFLTAGAAAAGACAAGLQGRLTRRLTPVFLAAISLGMVEAAHSLATMWTAPVMRGINEGDTAIPLGPFPAGDRTAMWLTAGAMALGIACVAGLLRSRAGIGLRMAAIEEREAAALGFNAPRIRVAAFVISGALAGVAGGLAAQVAGRVTPELFSLRGSLFVAAAAMLGGSLAVAGPAVAGYVTAALAQAGDVRPEVQVLAFAAVLAAASARNPRYLLGEAFGWNSRSSGAPSRGRPGGAVSMDVRTAGR